MRCPCRVSRHVQKAPANDGEESRCFEEEAHTVPSEAPAVGWPGWRCRRVAAAIGLWATPGFAAGAYHATQPVNVRSGPGTGTPVIGHEPNGAAFSLLCQWQGSTNVGGNSTWDKVAANSLTGAISDNLTNTPSFNSRCRYRRVRRHRRTDVRRRQPGRR